MFGLERRMAIPRAVRYLLFMLAGAVLPQAQPVPGARPLGIAFTASRKSTEDCLAAAIGSFFGHIMAMGTDGLAAGGTVVILCAVKFSLANQRIMKKPWFLPAAAGVIYLACAFPTGVGFFPLVSGAVLASAASAAFIRPETAPAALTVGLLLAAEPYTGAVSPYLAASAFICLWAGRRRGVGAGAVTGLLLGLAFDLSSYRPPNTAALFAAAGMFAGASAGRSGYVFASGLAFSCGLAAVWLGAGRQYVHLLAAAAVYLLLPKRFTPSPAPSEKSDAGDLSAAFRELSQSFMRETSEESAIGAMQSMSAVEVMDSARRAPGKRLRDAAEGVAKSYMPGARATLSQKDGLTVTVTPPLSDGDSFSRSLSEALKMDFELEKNGPDFTRLKRREVLGWEVHTACSKKESVSGDSLIWFRTEDGRLALLMSDGMGTGREARELSCDAVSLIRNFMQAGASARAAAGAVLPLLSARFFSRGFVTLDILEADPYTGKASLLKMGAPYSCLVRRGRVMLLGSRTLPAGADRAVPCADEIKLSRGDTLVMMTDGACENGLSGVRWRRPPETLAKSIISRARESGGTDDMTVAVISF